MWFLTIESIALLAVATTLGLFAGWLVWGGKPALSLAQVAQPSTPASFGSAQSEPAESNVSEVEPFSGNDTAGSIDSNKAEGLTGDTRLSPEEIDAGAFETLVEDELGVETRPPLLESYVSDETETKTKTGNRLVGSDESTNSEVVRSLELVASQLRTEIDHLSTQLENREADVVRLKAKLRKAVEEIEKRTALAQAARAELVDHQQRLAQNFTLSEPNVVPALQFALTAPEEHDDFAPAGTRFTPAEIDELIQAKTASLLIQTSQLERKTALIQSRAEEAEARVVALKAEAAQHQVESEAAFAKAEHDAADRILALEVDLASARQRTNMATQELMGFGSEISAIRDTNAKHLLSVHETMRELQHRLDTTKAALAGRSISALKPATNVSVDTPSSGSSLMILPGMTALLVDCLAELGISTLEDVASWTKEDVDHIQSLLPEDPEIVDRNGWVTVAQRSLEELSPSPEA